MAWITPKTNWVATDYFNIGDWERVRSNLLSLQAYLEELALGSFEVQSLDTPRGINSLPTSELINRLERSLNSAYSLVQNAIPGWQATVTWYARLDSRYLRNPAFTDWNRWEESIEQVRVWAPKHVAAQIISGEIYAGEV